MCAQSPTIKNEKDYESINIDNIQLEGRVIRFPNSGVICVLFSVGCHGQNGWNH